MRLQTTKRMGFKHFCEALALCADARGLDTDALLATVAATEPHVSGTIAGHVKWHDDRSTYTGVYAHGGPSLTDQQPLRLEELVDRTGERSRTRSRGSLTTAWAK